ncbi:hypothetical protein ACIP88_22475, partial [Streptomyces uncialis]
HAVEFSRNGRFLRTHPSHSAQAFLRALPFGVPDSIRPFPYPISSVLSGKTASALFLSGGSDFIRRF